MREQTVMIIDGLLEAPNRIMGAMLIEAIDFDLVIIGGGLSNVLPDGTMDTGDGVSLIEQSLKKNRLANVVLWSDKAQLQDQFQELLLTYKCEEQTHLCWKKQVSLQEIEENLLLIGLMHWQKFSKQREFADIF